MSATQGIQHRQDEGIASGIVARFADICGEQNLLVRNGFLAVSPANVQELSATMRMANELGLRVCASGSGTKTSWMGRHATDLFVLTQRMNAIREHIWQDMTCTVDAGCRWQEMQRSLAQHGQFVALDPLWTETATVGGVVAANDTGALRLAYGGLRDLVLGMTIVLADGTVARSGGKVVKNVAGYDLQKLMCGSFGTLGVIAEVTFRLHARPLHVQNFSFMPAESASVKPLHELMMRLLDSYFSVQSMQVFANPAGSRLDVRLAALPQVLEKQSRELQELALSAGLTMSDAAEDVWLERKRLLETDGDTAFKATMLPGDIAAVADAVTRAGGTAVAQATGILYGVAGAHAAAELASLRSMLQARGGALTHLRNLPPGEPDRWGIAPGVLRWMGELKRQFDPNMVLNPQCYEADV